MDRSSAACPLPDGSLCGTCPDCQADAINDAQWPDGGISVVIPERAAASTPGDAGQLGVSNDPACKRAAQVTSAAYTTQPFPYFIPSVFFWPYIYIWQAKGALNV